MSPSKRFENESAGLMAPKAGQAPWLEVEAAEVGWTAQRRRRIWVILSRAAVVYLVLFMGLGLIMSALGVNPLVNNGLMPKALLIFVGLALIMALANTLIDLCREQGRNWLRLARRQTTLGKKSDEYNGDD